MCRLLNPNFCTQEITGSKKVEFFYFPTAIQHEHKCISVKARGRKREREYDYCQNKLNRQEQKRILLAEIRNCSFSLHQHISNNANLPSAAFISCVTKMMPQGIQEESAIQ